MKKIRLWLRSDTAAFLLILLAVAAAAYGWHIFRVGYTNDDWYLMYAAKVDGPSAFSMLFSSDRPLRAYVLGPAYSLFGQNALGYNFSALFLRMLSTGLLVLLLRMLWPRQRTSAAAIGLLYFVYPGFLSQLNGIDYQPVILSMVAAALSIALSTYAFQRLSGARRIVCTGLAILLGWFYVGLVEYEMAFEILRVGIFFVLISRTVKKLRPRLIATFKAWLPYALIPAGFLVWNLRLFKGTRQATNLSSQLSVWLLDPLQTTYEWVSNWILGLVHALLSAWSVPLYLSSSQIPAGALLIGVLLAAAVAYLFYQLTINRKEAAPAASAVDWRGEALLLGLTLAAAGPLPIVLANREIIFPGLSRYNLVSSIGVAMVLVGSAYYLTKPRLRQLALSALLALAVLTQFAHGAVRSQQTAALNEFWWQVSWRVPQFVPNTTLLIDYPQAGLDEKYFVWSPANLIYYPDQQNPPHYLQPALFAALPNDETVLNVLTGTSEEFENRRLIYTYTNYSDIVILSQPTANSCVQVFDGAAPEFSAHESGAFISLASHSDLTNVVLDSPMHQPPAAVFGPEPQHGWCYFYEQAALARQRSEWAKVIEVGDAALAAGLRAGDAIEWLPFLQAYALAGQAEKIETIDSYIHEDDVFSRNQICGGLKSLDGVPDHLLSLVESLFCKPE